MNYENISALSMLAFGAGLSVAGFAVAPVGEIAPSVTNIFAQCLIYAGSIFGVGAVVGLCLHNLRHKGRKRKRDE